jgi:hypothetical protein
MTWSTFIIYLSLSYITYYILNLLYDLNRSKNDTSAEPQSLELFYHETSLPSPVLYEEQEALEEQDLANSVVGDDLPESLTDTTTDLKSITAQARADLQKLHKNI